jgi:hypothetical protein
MRKKCHHIDWIDNQSWNLAKRIEGEQPIAHSGHGTSVDNKSEEILITIF